MTTLLVTHAILMTLSILLTAGTAVAIIAKRDIPSALLAVNGLITAAGTFLGGYLLLSHPLDIRCAVLFAYLVAFVAISRLALIKNSSRQLVKEISR